MERYKKIDFKNFSEGEGKKYHEKDIFKYNASSKIKIDEISAKIRLQKSFTITALPFSPTIYDITHDDTTIYIVVFDGGLGQYKLYTSSNGTTFTLTYTFAALYTDFNRIIIKKGFLVVWFGNGHIARSTDGGSSFTFTATGTTIPDAAYIITPDMPILGNYVYIPEYTDKIWRTADFVSFEKIIAGQGQIDIEQLFEFNGFIYYVQGWTLFRIENEKPVAIRTFETYPRMLNIGKEIIVIILDGVSSIKLVLFDGTEFNYKTKIENYKEGYPIFEAEGSLYFEFFNTGTTCDIFRIDSKGNIFKVYTGINRPSRGFQFSGNDIFLSPVDDSIHKTNNYVLNGTIDLPIIDEGEIIPVSLCVRHKPLTSGCEVNLYVKKDQASSWGSAVLTNTTANSVKKRYKYPNGGPIVDFFQIQTELKTNNAANTPEDVSIEFLYLPAGLRNAK